MGGSKLKGNTMQARNIAVLFSIITALTLLSGCSSSGTQNADKFDKKVGELQKRAVKGSAQIDKTLAAMNGLSSEDVDLPKQYKSFSEQVKKTESGMKDSQKQKVNMQKASNDQIKAWKKQINSFDSEDMKQRSQERLDKVMAQRDELKAITDEIDKNADPFISGLNDIKTYLDVDLSPSSVASIADLIESTNKSGQEVKTNLDKLAAKLAELQGEETQ